LSLFNTEAKGNVLLVRIDGIKAGWEQDILLVSDQHHDSPFCDRKLEKQHLDEAKGKRALILMAGDTFDAMQGHKDPRASYDDLDPELKTDKYFDAVVEFNAKFYAPYAENIGMIGKGNHETSVQKHHNISLIDNLVYRMNHENESNIAVGGYGGWVKFLFTMDTTKRASLNLKYFHGSGGDAPVTRGVIQTARQAVYLPDADIVWNGHSHNEYCVPIQRERISQGGKIFQDTQWHIRTPGYKAEYGDGSSGWAVESGMPPKPLGCVWLHLYRDGDRIRIKAVQDVR
jgi:predicted phosphodiesterase